MKKLKFFFAAILVTGMMVSCSDDDDPAVSGSVEGRWNPVKTTVKVGSDTVTEPYDGHDPDCQKDYIEFADNAVLNIVAYNYSDISNTCVAENAPAASWGRSDNTITITGTPDGGNFDFDGTYTITKLNGSELRIQNVSTSGGTTITTTVFFSKAQNPN
jgi:hypothetical protein